MLPRGFTTGNHTAYDRHNDAEYRESSYNIPSGGITYMSISLTCVKE